MICLPTPRPSDVHFYQHPALPELLRIEPATSLAVPCVFTRRAAGGAFQGITHTIFGGAHGRLRGRSGCERWPRVEYILVGYRRVVVQKQKQVGGRGKRHNPFCVHSEMGTIRTTIQNSRREPSCLPHVRLTTRVPTPLAQDYVGKRPQLQVGTVSWELRA